MGVRGSYSSQSSSIYEVSWNEQQLLFIVLNIAKGSTGQTNVEQKRFLGLALRSYLETIGCLDIIERQGYLFSNALAEVRGLGHQFFIKLQVFRKALETSVFSQGEPIVNYT